MVEFNWSWADYEREKRKAERKAEREAARQKCERATPAPAPAPAAPPAPVDEPETPSLAEQLQHCKACGKKRLNPCSYNGCPIL
jgi:hypothetical protein